MMNNIRKSPSEVNVDTYSLAAGSIPNLADLAAQISANCLAIQTANAAARAAHYDAVVLALNTGDLLNAAKVLVPHGNWGQWLKTNFRHSAKTATDYMRLAEARSVVEAEAQIRSASDLDFSIRDALRLIRAATSKPQVREVPASPLSLASWAAATPEERGQFLDCVGLPALLGAMSKEMRSDIERRVTRQQAAASSRLAEKVTHALKQALSHAAMKKPDEKASAIAALNGVNNLLGGVGLDLHDIAIVIEAVARQRTA